MSGRHVYLPHDEVAVVLAVVVCVVGVAGGCEDAVVLCVFFLCGLEERL